MILTLFVLMLKAVVLPIPSESDLTEMGAILCGEACGMPREAKRLAAENIRRDWYESGTYKLGERWYAYKSDKASTEFMRDVFNSEFRYPWCRLIGNKYDPDTWVQRGVLSEGAAPDYSWKVLDGRFVLQAFGCWEKPLRIRIIPISCFVADVCF